MARRTITSTRNWEDFARRSLFRRGFSHAYGTLQIPVYLLNLTQISAIMEARECLVLNHRIAQ